MNQTKKRKVASRVSRSPKLILAAYYMAIFGEEDGARPPASMNAVTWTDAYKKLFRQLGDGREFSEFRNSIDQDRRHYLKCKDGTKTDTKKRQRLLGDEIWQAIQSAK